MRVIGLLLFAGALAVPAQAQDWAKPRLDHSPRHLEWVKVNAQGHTVNSFIAYPEVKQKATAVVLIHEIFGLSDWVRSQTDELAEAGYIAIAPDLLSGVAPGGGGTAELGGEDNVRKAISNLSPERVTTDLDAVTSYVSKLPACNGKVVVAGFCWGGGQSFRFATHDSSLKASLVFYGTGPEELTQAMRIECPVYGFYAGNDARIGATIPATVSLMKKAGKKYEPVTYEGAGHGFMRAGEAPDANEANKKARSSAWERMLKILKGI